jgi:hypothetical protein
LGVHFSTCTPLFGYGSARGIKTFASTDFYSLLEMFHIAHHLSDRAMTHIYIIFEVTSSGELRNFICHTPRKLQDV